MDENETYLDLDGVVLDSESRIIELKNQKQDLAWDQFFDELDWKRLLSESKEINDSLKIIRQLQYMRKKLFILTKVHNLKEMQAKVFDLRENRKIEIPIIFVPPHVRKSEIIIPDMSKTLIDDSQKNVIDWNNNNGNGILFYQNDIPDSKLKKVKTLEFLLDR